VLRERLLAEREPALADAERVDLVRGFADAAEPLEPELADVRFAVVERLAAVDRDVPDFARDALEREPLEARVPELCDDDEEDPEAPSSPLHLPLITRWAASATASAMMLPSLVALDIMLLAACDAVSAASSPASRILRRALGLALIAAAAAARPAASISLLIAALAILSMVSLAEEPDEPELEDRFSAERVVVDFAIVKSSLYRRKDTRKAVTVP
jgi:hypothetical protein